MYCRGGEERGVGWEGREGKRREDVGKMSGVGWKGMEEKRRGDIGREGEWVGWVWGCEGRPG